MHDTKGSLIGIVIGGLILLGLATHQAEVRDFIHSHQDSGTIQPMDAVNSCASPA